MIAEFFDTPGAFYRGNLHTHSTLSDGVLDPAEVCRRYREQGYDFLALTDHLVGQFGYPIADTLPFRTERFTTLLGAEVHTGAMENGEIWHLVAVGLPPNFEPPNAPTFQPAPDQETAASIAKRCREAGAFVAVAHPHWSVMTLTDALSIEAAHAVEIYNHGCAVESDRGDGWSMADLMLSKGRRVTAIATDDAHFKTADAFGGWVMVKAAANEPDALLDALKTGAFYSSQGPELHGIEIVGDTARIRSSAVVAMIVQGAGTRTGSVLGESLTEAEVPIESLKNSPCLRVTVIDSDGRRAWSNPIWRD